MTALYELSTAMAELSQMDEDQAVIDTLDGLEMEFNEKAQNIVRLMLNMGSDTEGLDNEIKRLQARKTVNKNRETQLKDYLRENMERTGISKIACPLFTVTCVKGRDVVNITDEDSLKDDCVNVTTNVKPDKPVILKKLKAGDDVPGAELIKSKSSIRIK